MKVIQRRLQAALTRAACKRPLIAALASGAHLSLFSIGIIGPTAEIPIH